MTFSYRSVAAKSPDFAAALARLSRRGESDLDRVEPQVREILAAVRAGGDRAVLEQVEKFEKRRPEQLLIRDYAGEAALAALPSAVREALELASARIRRYHEEQKKHLSGFSFSEGGICKSPS